MLFTKRDFSVSEGCILVFILAVALGGILSVVNPLERGMRALYFTNSGWIDPPAFTAHEKRITLDRMARVLPRHTTDFSVQWLGFLLIPEDGEYEFTLVSDDGSSLFLNQEVLIDNGGFHGKQERSGQRYLTKGFHAVHINYMQGEDLAIFRAFWTPPGQSRRPLSEAVLTLKPLSRKMYWIGWGIEVIVLLSKLLVGVCLLVGACVGLVRHRPEWLRWRVRYVGVAILMIVFSIHFGLSNITTPWDSKWSIHTALSIIREGNTDLDEYFPITQQFQDHTVARYFGHVYNLYPIGTALLAVPAVWLIDTFMEAGWQIDTEQFLNEYRLIPAGLEKCVASIIVALTSMLVYLLGIRLGYRHLVSVMVSLIFAFGTSAWSTASRALWQHGPTMLMLALTLYLLVLAERVPQRAYWAVRLLSLPLAFSFVIRPTNAVSIAAFSLLIFIRYRRHFPAYCLWSMVVAVPFMVYSLHVYHTPIPPYYFAQGQLGGGVVPFFQALAGTLISPSRGLFVFSPVLLFAMYGVMLSVRSKSIQALDTALFCILLLHWIVSALHPRWWGGHSYGPRYLSDMLPYLMYFLFPVVHMAGQLHRGRKIAFISVLVLAAGVSMLIHWRGATSQDVYGWNAGPVNVDTRPSRVWDWHDPQFLRGL